MTDVTAAQRTTQPGLAAIAAVAPDVMAGLKRLEEVTTADGALPGRIKALLAAAVAASKGYDAVMRSRLEAARDAGLTAAEVWGAASVLPTTRGATVADRFATVAIELFGAPEAGEPALNADLDEATAYFTEYYGQIPPRIGFLLESAPDAFVAFYLLHRGSLRSEGLEPKYRELLLCAVNASDWEAEFLRIHANAARSVGASREELVEAVLTALPVAGLAVWSGAAGVLSEIE